MKFFIWTDEASYTAFAHCESVTEARQMLREEIGGYDGSCPERERARKTMEEFTPSVYIGRIAGFRLSDSAEVRELEKYQEKLTSERDQLRAEVERLRGELDFEKAENDCGCGGIRSALRAATDRAETAERERDDLGAYSQGLSADLLAQCERAEAAEKLLAGLRGALEESRKDNKELDGTDAAHPAWWRGNDAGVTQICAKINAILDGADVSGTASEPWESTRRRVVEARKDSERLEWAWANPDKFAEAQRSTPPNRTGRQQMDAARGTK